MNLRPGEKNVHIEPDIKMYKNILKQARRTFLTFQKVKLFIKENFFCLNSFLYQGTLHGSKTNTVEMLAYMYKQVNNNTDCTN